MLHHSRGNSGTSFEVVKHVEAAELGLEDEDEDDIGTKEPTAWDICDSDSCWDRDTSCCTQITWGKTLVR